jgi:hypothetical protein
MASKHLAAQMLTQPMVHHINHIYTDMGVRLRIDKLLLENKPVWGKSLSNELGRLTQGVREVKGTDAMEFIPFHQVPKNKKVAYANMVCDHRPHKTEKYRVRLTIGGDVLDYFGSTASPAASLIETKLLLNSTISDSHLGARFCTIDIKDFFLQTILEDTEYLRIHEIYFLEDIRKRYNIDKIIANDGYVYCKVKKGLYGLKQALVGTVVGKVEKRVPAGVQGGK